MQTTHITPAECLLQRLLHSEKIDNYSIIVEKEEGYTNILFSMIHGNLSECFFALID